jgi:KTSC domain-containing protein
VADRSLKLGKSSQIHDGTYDPVTERLTVVLNGSTHAYHNVPSTLVDGLESAESHGDYFHKHIRNAHKVSRVR